MAEGACIESNQPNWATGALVLRDGTVFWAKGVGASGTMVGEVCFNTATTGYQEILTDPSYAGQIITFTFPHIGNVGTNSQDIEANFSSVKGCILRDSITNPANWRSEMSLDLWLKSQNLIAITGVDTRRLTRMIRDGGSPIGAISHQPVSNISPKELQIAANSWQGIEGLDLAIEVSCTKAYEWNETKWQIEKSNLKLKKPKYHIIAIDFGVKHNILRSLAELGCKITVVPASTTAKEVLEYKADGVFLSNGPGDPVATGLYAVPMIQELLAKGIPTFGICLGHQLLALALGAKTKKMHHGHRGANHPVKELLTGKVEITSQNHGFVVVSDSLPVNVLPTHISLFDKSIEGIKVKNQPAFSVQYHPESSPGPQDSQYLFEYFLKMIEDKN
ncbi:MAG: glutamine-hydrolyzing carbamoyl-phosphate synthase small subunit [Alphaproteobacteria bacterium]|nr:glutamine-hydrolyzing carbamoyl-phosphate synthase small subunit [Alphaproteobacteria bacterium]